MSSKVKSFEVENELSVEYEEKLKEFEITGELKSRQDDDDKKFIELKGLFDARHFRGGPGGNWYGNYTTFDGDMPDDSDILDDDALVSEWGAPGEI